MVTKTMDSSLHIQIRRHFWVSEFKILVDYVDLPQLISTVFHGSYFAPEYFMYGIVDEKTDVFAFGVLLLELITGQRAFNSERQSILLWVCFDFPANV